MPRIKPLKNHELDEFTTGLLTGVGSKLGLVPNLFSTLANAPVALKSYLDFSETLASGVLTAKQREIVALSVSQYNHCQYCLSAHNVLGKGAGLTDEDIVKARDGKADDALSNAVASFAREVAENRGVISNDRFNYYAAQGLNSQLMVEIIANVALNTLTNYLNHIAETDIDFPLIELSNSAAA